LYLTRIRVNVLISRRGSKKEKERRRDLSLEREKERLEMVLSVQEKGNRRRLISSLAMLTSESLHEEKRRKRRSKNPSFKDSE